MSDLPYSSRWPQLAKWWDSATVTRTPEVDAVAKRLVAAKDRYQKVEAKTGVPWWLIAAIHEREGSQKWTTQLAQGDPLNQVSTHVPAGMGPFKTWEDGAVAALEHDKLTSVTDWCLEKALYWAEKYNGLGYFYRGLPSAYVWAATSVQRPGKFTDDGSWSSTTMDRQLGCAAMLKGMMAVDPTIKPLRESLGGVISKPAVPGAHPAKGTGAGLLARAKAHIGEPYVNVLVPKDNSQWKGPWDCAEFVSWLVYQEAGILYGCVNDDAKPSEADAYTGAWRSDVARLGTRVSVETAAATVGGIVLRYPPPSGMGHVALCDGKGGTVEAKGRNFGVVADHVHDRPWDTGILIPGIQYDPPGDISIKLPDNIYRVNLPNMDSGVIIRIQKALQSKGFSPGEIDGEYGPETESAVVAFQMSEGLVVDGQTGPDTARALGISLERGTEASKPTEPGPITKAPKEEEKPVATGDILKIIPVGGMGNPLIDIAAGIFPDILKTIIGDKSGKVVGAVQDAVSQATQAKTPEEARNKLNADPATVAALKVKLAEISADQEQKRQQVQLDELKAQYDSDARKRDSDLTLLKLQFEEGGKKRDAELEQMRVATQDTANARDALRAYAGQGGRMVAWAAPLLSYIVIAGFFVVLIILLFKGIPTNNNKELVAQIVNIVIGALVAGFATVLNFWLGSSRSSQNKDADNEKQRGELQKTLRAAIDKTSIAETTKTPEVAKSAAAVKSSNLQRCVDVVMAQESVYHRAAGEGAERFGFTLDEYRTALDDKSLTAESLAQLTRDKAREIYRARYWNVLNCDDLPAGVDLVVLDFGVEGGTMQSAKLLQDVVGAEQDGAIGPATIAATKVMAPSDVVKKMTQRRLDYHRDQPYWGTSGKDRTDRANAVQEAALAMMTSTGQ